jgi:hypothetical protein
LAFGRAHSFQNASWKTRLGSRDRINEFETASDSQSLASRR